MVAVWIFFVFAHELILNEIGHLQRDQREETEDKKRDYNHTKGFVHSYVNTTATSLLPAVCWLITVDSHGRN